MPNPHRQALPITTPASAAPAFAALGDRTRLTLLTRLSDGNPRSIADLSTDATMTRQAVTKHLRILEDAGLIESARTGRETRFAFRPDGVAELREYLDGVARQWEDALGRLLDFVEG